MSSLIQRNFAGGELDPALHSRVDTVKYATGLKTLRNAVVMKSGGIRNRAGTNFIGSGKTNSRQIRLIPFVYGTDQTYLLELGRYYMRVIKDDAYIMEASKSISSITKANPGLITVTSHGYSNGDDVYLSVPTGMTELNGRTVKISGVTTNTFEIKDQNSANIDTTSYTTYSSGGTVRKIYEIVTPYLETDLMDIRFVQAGNVITLTHSSYFVQELKRTADDAWTMTDVDFGPLIHEPDSVTNSGAAGTTTQWVVTAVDDFTGEESAHSLSTGSSATPSSGAPITVSWSTTRTITGITQANPAVVTSASHGYADGDQISISSVVGMTEVNDQIYTLLNTTTNTYELYYLDNTAVDSSAFTAYSSGGFSQRFPLPGYYNVYKKDHGIYGFIGTSIGGAFIDSGIPADVDNGRLETLVSHPFGNSTTQGRSTIPNPLCVANYQQRSIYANTLDNPEGVYASRIGRRKNFNRSFPTQDDDPVNFTVTGRKLNDVQHMVDIGSLVLLTSTGEIVAQGDQAGILKPTDVNTKQYSFHGSGKLGPIVLDNNFIFCQPNGSVVRDFAFDYQIDGYRGNDMTVFSYHLFEGYSIIDWDFQKSPNSIVWAARSDGTFLGLTYLREHQIYGWHRHDTDGVVENVCCLPGENETDTYLVVKRTVDEVDYRYIEKFSTRIIDDIVDANFMDSSLSYDGRNTGSTTMTLSGGTSWTYDETLTLTASASFFLSTDVGNQIQITDADGVLYKFTIAAYTSGTVVTGSANKTIPVALRSVATTNWAKAVDQVGGLWHLEGKDVSVFGDGYVVASPNNDAYDIITVAAGIATLPEPYAVIQVGLPYISDIQTLDIDTANGETIMNKKKLTTSVTLDLYKTRGLWIGGEPPSDDDTDPLENLYELKLRDSEGYDEPNTLKTGTEEINIDSSWNSNGRVFIRQVDPLPVTILSVVPSGYFPFKGGP